MAADSFTRRLLAWHRRHGRHDLPWQRTRDPYRVWVSEIMLQQTQVATVIPYYERFLARFPDVGALARARLDTVLHHWTGLGYYARARHLHAAAKQIVARYRGRFPRTLEDVTALPGIGRSTAGAILAFAFDQPHPILDGNVKRVLTRFHAIDAPVTHRDTETLLWQLASRHTPRAQVARYTQAIMDLGATLCARAKPRCADCPVAQDCAARKLGTPERFPVRGAKRARPLRHTVMLMIRDRRGQVLLARRPTRGLWGGLWSLPETTVPEAATRQVRADYGLRIALGKPWPPVAHDFTHFRMMITPIPARVLGEPPPGLENATTVWYNAGSPGRRGFSAPVKQLLQQLRGR
jgi:A/G-specific adenine glycosylase